MGGHEGDGLDRRLLQEISSDGSLPDAEAPVRFQRDISDPSVRSDLDGGFVLKSQDAPAGPGASFQGVSAREDLSDPRRPTLSTMSDRHLPIQTLQEYDPCEMGPPARDESPHQNPD